MGIFERNALNVHGLGIIERKETTAHDKTRLTEAAGYIILCLLLLGVEEHFLCVAEFD